MSVKASPRDSRCRHTGQNHPLAFFFLRSRVGAGGGIGVAAAPAPAAPTSPGVPAPASGFASAPSSRRATLPPAPNSIMPTAHSRQTTRWRHGRSTTSRGEVRHTMHSLGVDAYGSSPALAAGG